MQPAQPDPLAELRDIHLPGPIEVWPPALGWWLVAILLSCALLALVMVFLPGALLVAAALPYWASLRANQTARAGLNGVNAAVVGVLAAALYTPVTTTAINDWTDIAIAVLAFVALAIVRMPAWSVVPIGAALGMAVAAIF